MSHDAALSPDGSKTFVTGWTDGPTGTEDYATVAYDAATGTQLWARTYDGTAHQYDEGWAIAVSADGSRVFVTGGSEGVGTSTDFATVAYDAVTGQSLWLKRYQGGYNYDFGVDVAASLDGSAVFVTGQSQSSNLVTDFLTIAYDERTGATLWEQRQHPCSGSCAAIPESATMGPDGQTLFVTGAASTGTPAGFGFYTVATDPISGAVKWDELTSFGDRQSFPYFIAVSPDGSKVFIAGHSTSLTDCCNNGATAAYDATTGGLLWLRRFSKHQFYWDADVTGLAVGAGGAKVYITGTTQRDAFAPDGWALAYDASSGRTVWSSRLSGRYSNHIVVSPDGSKVFVGLGTNDNHVTAASLEASKGTILWQAQDVPGYPGANVLVSQDGSRLFLSTTVEDPPSVIDFETIAYST